MKIEVDLADLFVEKGKTTQEALRDAVIAAYVEQLDERVIRDAIIVQVQQGAEAFITREMPAVFAAIIDQPYIPTDRFGVKGKPTSLREVMHKELLGQMIYKKQTYDSDRNYFTRAIDAVISANMTEFKKLWQKEVDEKFLRDALAHAVDTFARRAGVKS